MLQWQENQVSKLKLAIIFHLKNLKVWNVLLAEYSVSSAGIQMMIFAVNIYVYVYLSKGKENKLWRPNRATPLPVQLSRTWVNCEQFDITLSS